MPWARDIPAVLSIAGSDSGGGAGIQADLKAFARCGVHGMTAITAITAQNTVEVAAVEAVSPRMIVQQVRAVNEDIGVDGVKIGMLGSAETIAAVGEALDLLDPELPVVLDPVMVAESGAMLLDSDARTALARELIPRVIVTTPNMAEARVLAGIAGLANPANASQEELAEAVLSLEPFSVVVTGGHTEDGGDLLLSGGTRSFIQSHGPFEDGAGHGSGCTHSSILAARLALGDSLIEAAEEAHALAATAVDEGLRDIGGGAGPVDVIGLPSQRGVGRSA